MRPLSLLAFGLISMSAPAVAGVSCMVNFDSDCPTESHDVCGVNMRSDVGCVVDGLGLCYDTGVFAVRVNAGDTAIFRLPAGTDMMEVFFADTGGAVPGQFRVLSASGQPLARIFSNGNCTQTMPVRQTIQTAGAARWVVVKAGDSNVYVDSLEIY